MQSGCQRAPRVMTVGSRPLDSPVVGVGCNTVVRARHADPLSRRATRPLLVAGARGSRAIAGAGASVTIACATHRRPSPRAERRCCGPQDRGGARGAIAVRCRADALWGGAGSSRWFTCTPIVFEPIEPAIPASLSEDGVFATASVAYAQGGPLERIAQALRRVLELIERGSALSARRGSAAHRTTRSTRAGDRLDDPREFAG